MGEPVAGSGGLDAGASPSPASQLGTEAPSPQRSSVSNSIELRTSARRLTREWRPLVRAFFRGMTRGAGPRGITLRACELWSTRTATARCCGCPASRRCIAIACWVRGAAIAVEWCSCLPEGAHGIASALAPPPALRTSLPGALAEKKKEQTPGSVSSRTTEKPCDHSLSSRRNASPRHPVLAGMQLCGAAHNFGKLQRRQC